MECSICLKFVLIALPLPLFLSGSKVMLVRWMQILSVMHRSRIGHTYIACMVYAPGLQVPYSAPQWVWVIIHCSCLVGGYLSGLYCFPCPVWLVCGWAPWIPSICNWGQWKWFSLVEVYRSNFTEIFRSGKNWRALGPKDRWISAQNSAVFIVLLELCICLRTFSACTQNHVHACWTGTE